MRFTDDNMRKLLQFGFACFIVCNFVTLAGCQTKEEKFDAIFKNCEELIENKESKKAVICFEEAVKINPKSVASYIYLADEYRKLNQFDKAEEAIKKALLISPERAMAHNTYGLILEEKGDLQGALKEHKQAVKLEPKKDWMWVYLAFAQTRVMDTEGAIESYNQALAINSNDTLSLYFLGKLYEQTGNKNKAIETFEKLFKINSDYEDVKERLERLKRERELEQLKNKPKKKAKAA